METAVVKIASDVISSNDSDKVTVFVLPKIFATFNTIDPLILLKRLATDVGVTGIALS